MSYEAPFRQSYAFPAVNFGSTTLKKIRGPKGMTGKVVSIHAYVTTLFTAVTTEGAIALGSDASTNKDIYASMGMSTTAALATRESSNVTGAIKTGSTSFATKDTDIFVNFVAPTGGSPAGVADVNIVIEWF